MRVGERAARSLWTEAAGSKYDGFWFAGELLLTHVWRICDSATSVGELGLAWANDTLATAFR